MKNEYLLDDHLLVIKKQTENKIHIKFEEVSKVIFKTDDFIAKMEGNSIDIIEKRYNVIIKKSYDGKYTVAEPNLTKFNNGCRI